MWKWQVKVKNCHFFGEDKLWGSKFFESIHITNSSKTRLGCGPYVLKFCGKITKIYCVPVGHGHMAVEMSVTNSFSRAKFRISDFFLFMNLHESVGDFMIFYSSNFKFYHKVDNPYDKPWQNLLHKICSAYVTKPFRVVATESGAGYKFFSVLCVVH